MLWPRVADDGTRAIKIYVYNNRKKDYINTGYHVNEKHWDQRFLKVKKEHPNADLYNANIQAIITDLEKQMLSGIPLKSIKSTDPNDTDFISFIKQFIAECVKGTIKRAPNTIRHYQVNLRQIQNYCSINGPVSFESLNKDFYLSFIEYYRKQGHIDSTIGGKVKFIKLIINEAIDRGITNTIEHKKKYFKRPTSENDSIYFNEAEINSIVKLDLSSYPTLQAERDRFIISYYFLLRFEDSLTFNETNFQKKGDVYYFTLLAGKTKNKSMVPVKPFVYDILKRYNFKMPKAFVQKANDKIKEVARLAGIVEVISLNGEIAPKYSFATSHTARRSGATNLYLSGLDEKTIMDLGGWKSTLVFRQYIKITKFESAEKAAKIDFYR